MDLTAEEYQELLLMMIGESPDGIIQPKINLIWKLHSAQPTLFLQFIAAKIAALDILIGQASRIFNQKIKDQSREEGKWFDNLLKMKEAALTEKTLAEQDLLSLDYSPIVGRPNVQSPLPSPPNVPDRNDPYYYGNTYTSNGLARDRYGKGNV